MSIHNCRLRKQKNKIPEAKDITVIAEANVLVSIKCVDNSLHLFLNIIRCNIMIMQIAIGN